MTARELALLVLDQRFSAQRTAASPDPGLASFQQEAKQRLLAAIQARGGALLADSVGLGKTHVAAAVAQSLAGTSGSVVAVVPTALLRLWRRALRHLPGALLLTHATLSRGGCSPTLDPTLVLVDEAHSFRNPRTRRYAALARLTTGRRVLLLSATPVNNSVWDLYWLLRLFADDHAFGDVGVEHLGACFDRAHRTGRADRIPAVLAAVAVRRSREVISELHGKVSVGGRVLSFPRRSPPSPVRYELPAMLLPLLSGGIEELELGPWRGAGGGSTLWLIRLLLLKRLESSAAALRASLQRLYGALRRCADALDRGLLPDLVGRDRGDAAQLRLDELLLRPAPPGVHTAELRASVERDVERLRRALTQLETVVPADPKLGRLTVLLESGQVGRPVLLFSQFRETADYLWHSLRGTWRCGLIHGTGAWLGSEPAARRAVIERFAPIASGVPPPPVTQRVELLIATDVLAEGLNLQDAGDVISYDLPWNPVRLVQRLGRVDRLGSPHECVRSWYFVPHAELEDLLGLLRRIRRKLRAISRTVGQETPVLEPVAGPAALRMLANGIGSPFREAERRREGLFDIEERLRAALRRAVAAGDDALAGLPLASTPTHSAGGRRGRSATRTVCSAGLMPRAAFAGSRSRRGPASALVFLLASGAQRAVFVGGRGCWEDDLAAGNLLLHALNHASSTPMGEDTEAGCDADAKTAARAAVRWIQRPRRPAPVGSCVRRLRKRLLRLLQAAPGGAAAEDCRRAEALLASLARGIPVAAEVEVREIDRSRNGALGDLLERLEAVLPASARLATDSVARPRQPGGQVTVTGVFVFGSAG